MIDNLISKLISPALYLNDLWLSATSTTPPGRDMMSSNAGANFFQSQIPKSWLRTQDFSLISYHPSLCPCHVAQNSYVCWFVCNFLWQMCYRRTETEWCKPAEFSSFLVLAEHVVSYKTQGDRFWIYLSSFSSPGDLPQESTSTTGHSTLSCPNRSWFLSHVTWLNCLCADGQQKEPLIVGWVWNSGNPLRLSYT